MKKTPMHEHGSCICYFLIKYLFLVAAPPRIWRSALFWSRTCLVALYNEGFIFSSRSVMSLCMVDLLIPNFWAVARIVELLSTKYSAARSQRCLLSCLYIIPHLKYCLLPIYARIVGDIQTKNAPRKTVRFWLIEKFAHHIRIGISGRALLSYIHATFRLGQE